MSEDIRTSVLQWATQLELACKAHPVIRHYEISVDFKLSTSFRGDVDNRGRWSSYMRSEERIEHIFQVRIFLDNNQQSFIRDNRRFGDPTQSPQQIVEHLLAPSTAIPCHPTEGIFALPPHLNSDRDIFDPRFPMVDSDLRKELMVEHVQLIRHMNKQARLQQLTLVESSHFRHFRSSNNSVLSEQGSHYQLNGIVQQGLQQHSFSFDARRFADLLIHPFGWSEMAPPPKQSRLITEINRDWMLMLPPNIIASILEQLPPAFMLERLEDGSSFLANKIGEQIGSKRIHLIDDANMLSGLNTRLFDARGVPPKPLTLIADGVMQDTYVSLQQSQQYKLQPTGHQNIRNELWCGNLMSQMGRRSQNMILADKGDALLATHLLEPTHLNIETGMLRFVANFDYLTSKGSEGRLGPREIEVPILDLFAQVEETANDQHRYNHVDASTWVLEDCRLLI